MLHGTVIAPDESQFAVSTSKFPGIATGSAAAGGDVVVIPDAFLLFNCEFKRVGDDLRLIGEDGRTHTVPDYFKGDKHPTLATPQGAQIPAAVIDALAGGHHEQYAQAGAQPGTAEAIGKVATTAGNATIVRNGVAVTVNAGDVVLKNDVLRTGGDGALGVTFNDGTTFSLSANAQMSVNEFVYQDGGANNQAVFNLVRGSISFFASQVAKTGDMKVSTPTATMGIRGTTVVVDITVNTQTGNIGQVQIKLYADANGNVGRVEVFSTTGALLGTLTATATGFVITPGQTQPADAEQVSQQDAARDLALLQQLFNSTNIGNQLLQQQGGPQDPQNSNPNTNGSNGSSTNPNIIITLDQTQNDNGTTTTTITDVVINPPALPPSDPNLPNNTPDPIPVVIDPQNVPTVTTIVRGDGDDEIEGTPGADIIFAGGGYDTIYGSAGDDQIFGQGDDDTVSYAATTQGVIVNLVTGTATGAEIGTDTLVSIENAIGGSGNDIFLVDDSDWSIDGGAGIDRIKLVGDTNIVDGEIGALLLGDSPGGGDQNDGPHAENIEILDLNDTHSNTVDIDLIDIIGLNDDRTIRVVGGGEGTQDNFNVENWTHPFGYWRLADQGVEWDGEDELTPGLFNVFEFVNYWGHVQATVWIEQGVQSNLFEMVEPDANPDFNSVWEAGVGFNGWPWQGDPTANGNVLFNDTLRPAGLWKHVASAGAGDAEQTSLHPFFGVLLIGTYGTLRLYGNGQYQYTLNNNDSDTQALNWGDVEQDIFTYTMVDAQGLTSETTLTINVSGANDAPNIWGGQTTGTVIEAGYNSQGQPRGDATATGFLFKSDVDGSASNDAWSVVRGFGQTSNPDGSVTGRYGTLSVNEHGQWTYTLDDNDPDTQALNLGDTRFETFTVRVTDEYGASDTQTVRVTVRGSSDEAPNEAPVADALAITAYQNATSAFFYLSGTDQEEGEITTFRITSLPNPLHGTLGVNYSGTSLSDVYDEQSIYNYRLAFEPEDGWTGVTTFTYVAVDSAGQDSEEVTVTITVLANAAPVALDAYLGAPKNGVLNPLSGHYYKFVPAQDITWEQASAAALSHGAYLATITSETENEFIVENVLGQSHVWIGGSDAGQEDVWRWMAGPEAGQALSYFIWDGGEPNNVDHSEDGRGEDYLQLLAHGADDRGEWNDEQGPDVSSANSTGGYIEEWGGYGEPIRFVENAVTRIPIATILAHVVDTDEDQLSITVGGANYGNVRIDGDYIVYTPADGYSGPDSFTYTVSDGKGGADTATVYFAVESLVRANVATNSGFDMGSIIPGFIDADLDAIGQNALEAFGLGDGILLSHEGRIYAIPTENLAFAPGVNQNEPTLTGGTITGLYILDEQTGDLLFSADGFDIDATAMQAAIQFYDDNNDDMSQVEDLLGAHSYVIGGGEGSDTLAGGIYNDTIDGGGGADLIDGDAGDDLIIVRDNAAWTVNGGAGVDTLRFDGDFNLPGEGGEGGQYEDQEVTGVEIIDFGSETTNNVFIDAHSIAEMSQDIELGAIRVLRGPNDTLTLVPGYEQEGSWEIDEVETNVTFNDGYTDGVTFDKWVFSDGTTLYVQQVSQSLLA